MLDKFYDYLLINGKSYHTAKNYIGRIESLLKNLPEEQLTEQTLSDYLREIQKDYSISKVNGYKCAIINYLRFIKKDIKLPKFLKRTKTLPQSFDIEQFNDIINVLSQVLHNDFPKWEALLTFLFYSGIRIGEIDNIKRSDFDLEKKRIKILIPKTKEERIVFFPDEAKQALERYFNFEPEETNAFNINSSAVQKQMQRLQKYFPNYKFHAHLFRHSFAIKCLQNGTDISVVSKLLGHKNLSTTMCYLQLTNTQIEEIYRKYNDKGDIDDRPKA